MRDAEKTIGSLIEKSNVSFISTIDSDGFPNTKAMLKPVKRDGIKVIYFHTNTSSMKVNQYRLNPKACLYFLDRRFFRGVMLRGTMEVLTGQDIKSDIWQEGFEMYYPLGETDPDYCILKFTSIDGRYYSNFSSENFTI